MGGSWDYLHSRKGAWQDSGHETNLSAHQERPESQLPILRMQRYGREIRLAREAKTFKTVGGLCSSCESFDTETGATGGIEEKQHQEMNGIAELKSLT